MARSFALRAKLQFTYIFNVDQAVGATGPNRREDVLLIQYLLAVWMAHEEDPRIQQIITGAPVVKPDGICGDKTKGAIKGFERAFPQVTPDGNVDPIVVGVSTTTGKTMKLFLLNQILFSAGGLRGGLPETKIEFPRDLIAPLFRG